MNQYSYRCTITWSGPQPMINGLLWVIVFILASGELPEEHIWMAKWDCPKTSQQEFVLFLSPPLFDFRHCIAKGFLAKSGFTVGVSKTLRFSWNYNCPLAALWMSHRKIHILTRVSHANVWPKNNFFSASVIIYNQYIFIVVAVMGFRVDLRNVKG